MTNDERAFLAQVAMGWFSVDEKGRIWRTVKFTGGRGNTALIRLPRPIRAEKSKSRKEDGYLRVMFRDAMTAERLRVGAHRIIWIVHNRRVIPHPFEVNHKNGNKADNLPINLELVVRSQNVLHAIHVLGKIHKQPKTTHGAMLTEEQVHQIRALYTAKAMTLKGLAEHFGVHWHTIQNITLRKTWQHVD